ncbi:hypothetical protein BTHERMOSOX_138 [Bathymodiolus thermophilus thioautotrophic gill symbiont]|nr:hypothetical protein BTHERMOSOX_138 [Bathymodiolus thermophilus thioautotrophic gill symbiont]
MPTNLSFNTLSDEKSPAVTFNVIVRVPMLALWGLKTKVLLVLVLEKSALLQV